MKVESISVYEGEVGDGSLGGYVTRQSTGSLVVGLKDAFNMYLT
jgi:hypothetical protein